MASAEIRDSEQAWRQAEAAMLDAKADTIDVARRALQALDGMFVGREEPRRIIAACEDTLMMESENMRSQVRRALGEPAIAAVAGSPNVSTAEKPAAFDLWRRGLPAVDGSGVGELGA